ncbi:MAG: hypothetical protein AABZ92_04320 [Verrucomicrobiota bacterium]
MSVATTSVQSSPKINTNFTQDPQKSTSLHGRVFHKISDGGKCIIQSINKVAQSILSTCIYVVSFGRCDLDSLKNYLFSNQTALKGDESISSNHLPTRSAPPLPPSAPPPPPVPTSEQLNRVSSSRSSSAETREPGDLNRSSSVRSNLPRQDFSQEDSTNVRETSSSLLGTNTDYVSEQEDSESSHKEIKTKDPKAGFIGVTKNNVMEALKNLRKTKKINQE